MTNHLYYGDNLAVLRDSIAAGSVDLVYLDPRFNSSASYNVPWATIPSLRRKPPRRRSSRWRISRRFRGSRSFEEALAHRDRAVKLPARRDDAFKHVVREEVPARQGRLDL